MSLQNIIEPPNVISEEATIKLVRELNKPNYSLLIIQEAISEGADINIYATDDSYTLLMFAIKNGHEELALEAISKGADVNAAASITLDVLMLACISSFIFIEILYIRLFDDLIQNDPTASEGFAFLASIFFTLYYVNQYDGATPLALAIRTANKEIASKLIDYGADFTRTTTSATFHITL